MPSKTFEKLSEGSKKYFLDAALAEFSEHTYEQAGIRGICARTGLSIGGFYCYFSSKEELYIYLLDHMHSRLFRQTEALNCSSDDILAQDPAQARFWESFSKSSMDILGKYYLRTSSYGLYPEELKKLKDLPTSRDYSEMQIRFVAFVLSSMVFTIYKFCEEEQISDPGARDILWHTIKNIILKGYKKESSDELL